MTHADKVAAFFDLDGTLLPKPSLERRFLLYLLMHKKIGSVQFAECARNFLRHVATNPSAAIQANKSYLSGIPTSCAEAWSVQLASHLLKFFSAGLRLLESHFAQGHRVFIITGAPAPLVELIGKFLPVPAAFVATELDSRCGLWTGEIRGEHMSGAAKQRAILHLAAAHELSLANCFAYGDSFSDLPMLQTAGFPATVNPAKRLERFARQRAWPVLRWQMTESRLHDNLCRAIERSQPLEAAFVPIITMQGEGA
ncbi:MAG: HAD family hydrolase [Candidatus Acidiferrales bacterium]